MPQDKRDFADWIGLNSLPDFTKSKLLGGFVGRLIFIVSFGIAFGATSALVWLVVTHGDHEAIRNIGLVVAGIIGAPFVIWRSYVAHRTANITEHGQVTDRINTAVQGLGADKTVKDPDDPDGAERTVPNMEVRIGSIYALARIARENLSFHVQIMQILCAYVRENSKAEGAMLFKMPDMPGEDVEEGGLQAGWRLWKADLDVYISTFKQSLKPKTDIQTVLEVLGRRTPEQQAREAGWPNSDKDGVFVFATIPKLVAYPNDYDPAAHAAWAKQMAAFKSDVRKRFRAYTGYRLDLRKTNLQGYDLGKLNFRGARFDLAQMQAADLTGAQIQGATLSYAQMQWATLSHAEMQGADLTFAEMERADLRNARMQGADLMFARMQGADLSNAQMSGADLGYAEMQGADLSNAQMSEETNLTNAVLTGALVRSVDKTTIEKLRPFWSDIFADGTVVVPEGERPAHWPTEKLVYTPWDPKHSPFGIECHKWLSNPASYTPPKPGTPD
jgi:uncharacterized protein YjbI with pentapeptide repeats